MPVDESAELQQLIMMSGEAPDDQVENVLLRLSEAGLVRPRGTRPRLDRDQRVRRPADDHAASRWRTSRASRRCCRSASPTSWCRPRSSRSGPSSRRAGGASAADYFGLIAGPCTVESREQTLETARAVNAAGATMLRGGAFKPRTSPYSFQGLGTRRCEILAEAREDTGLPMVTEVLDPRQLRGGRRVRRRAPDRRAQHAELPAAGRVRQDRKPVLLKRGPRRTIEELLMAAEYILERGQPAA